MPSFFNKPSIKRIKLDDYEGYEGEWVELKERLSYGEEQKLAGSGIVGLRGKSEGNTVKMADDPDMVFDMERFQIELFHMWIVDWSFRDENDKPVKVSKASISNLDSNTGDILGQVLQAHIEEYEARKKVGIGKKQTAT